MSRVIYILGLLLAQWALAQGYVAFANKYTDLVDAPVLVHLAPYSGPGPEWTAQLFLKKDDSLTPLGSSPFRGGDGAIHENPLIYAYWFYQTIAVPGLDPGETATFLVRAWKTSFGSYETAASFGYSGESLPVTVTLGMNPTLLR